ncbi:hypothetical protein Aduo_018609 [Ancylostoma duodenale]
MEEDESVYNLNGQDVTLSEEQREAVDFAASTLPVVGIQAAFGTGKTVVGAIIAAGRSSADYIIVDRIPTPVLRFVSDAAEQENGTPTPVDMNRILMTLGEEFDAELTDEEKALCRKFKAGRTILERHIENPDLALDMLEEDKEDTPSPSTTFPAR